MIPERFCSSLQSITFVECLVVGIVLCILGMVEHEAEECANNAATLVTSHKPNLRIGHLHTWIRC